MSELYLFAALISAAAGIGIYRIADEEDDTLSKLIAIVLGITCLILEIKYLILL